MPIKYSRAESENLGRTVGVRYWLILSSSRGILLHQYQMWKTIQKTDEIYRFKSENYFYFSFSLERSKLYFL